MHMFKVGGPLLRRVHSATSFPVPHKICLSASVSRQLPGVNVYGYHLALTPKETSSIAVRLPNNVQPWQGKTKQDVLSHPLVAAAVRFNAAIGLDKDKYPPSTLNLLQRYILKSKPLPLIHPIVDLVNLAVIDTLVPLGAFDAQCVEGSLQLTYSQGGEEFLPLGANRIEFLPKNILLLRDEQRVLSRFACRDGDAQKITQTTSIIWLLGCEIPGIEKDVVMNAMNRACQELSTRYVLSHQPTFKKSTQPDEKSQLIHPKLCP